MVKATDSMIATSHKMLPTLARPLGVAVLAAVLIGMPDVATIEGRQTQLPNGNQVTFEKTVADLSSQDAATRLRAVQMLKAAGYPEAAVPMASAILDPFDETQLEAIAAEL